MPIRVQCPQCGKEYNVGDDKAGRRFQCKGCQASVVVPAPAVAAADDDPFAGMDFGEEVSSPSPKPAGAKKKSSDGKGQKGKKGKTESAGLPVGAWIGIGVAAVAVIAVGVFLMTRGGGDDEAANIAGNDNVAGNNTVAGGNANDQEAAAPAIESVAELEAARENLYVISVAMHNYSDVWSSLPVARNAPEGLDPDGKAYLSWRVHLLPFLEQQELYDKFRLNESWDSPHNLPLASQMPDVFKSAGDAAGVTTTRYLTFVGPGTAYENGGPRYVDLRDGMSNTILIAQVPASKAVPWTKPEDAVFDPAYPFSCVGAIPPRGMPIALADAACAFLSPTTDAAAFTAWLGAADGQVSDSSLLLRAPIAGEVSVAAAPANTPSGQGGTATTPIPTESTDTGTHAGPPRALTTAEQGIVQTQLKDIVLGMHNYHDNYRSFPVADIFADGRDPDGKPYLSWRVHLLPFLDQQNLYDRFHLNEPWDSPHNLPLADLMPAIFKTPGDESGTTVTRFVVFSGPTAMIDGGIGKGFQDMLDGTSYTIAVAHAPASRAVPWTKPEDPAFDAADPFASIGGAVPPEGLPVGMADGACFFLSPEADAAMFASFVQPADAQVVNGELLLHNPANYVVFQPPRTPPAGRPHLAYLTDDTIGLMRIVPRKLLEAEWIASALPPNFIEEAPVPLDILEESLFWISPRADAPIPAEPDSQFALRFSRPVDVEELPLNQLPPDSRPYFHNENTVVFARGDRFERMFSGSGSSSPLHATLLTAQLDADIYLAFQLQSETFNVDWSEAQLMLATAGSLGYDLMQAQQVQLAFRASESPLLKVWLTFPDDPTATSYKETLEQQLPELLDLQKSNPMTGALATLLADAWSVNQEGTTVSLEIAHSDELCTELASIVTEVMSPAVMSNPAPKAAQITQNNFRQILIAAHNYLDTYKVFPVTPQADAFLDDEGKPFLSWRVHLLPYLDEQALYDEFRLDEPWDSEHNIQLQERMPAIYQVEGSEDLEPGMTRIARLDGAAALCQDGLGGTFADVIDGLSNTAYCFTVGPEHAVPWTKPEDIVIDFSQPIWPQLGIPEGEHWLVGICDGVVLPVATTLDEANLMRLLKHNDGELLELP